MIYALVEPSIYMIASILPPTRHLYRRIRQRNVSVKGSELEHVSVSSRGDYAPHRCLAGRYALEPGRVDRVSE